MINTDKSESNKSIEYINNLDFSNIIEKLVHQMGWQKEHALQTCQLYRNYLILKKKFDHLYELPPSEDIDEFWHMHILDTKAYQKDCDIIFGYYLEHYPYLGIDNKTDLNDLSSAFDRTQELYEKEFGEGPIPKVRSFLAKLKAFVKSEYNKA
ncbi:MAG: hypothetical protein H6731_01775 [Myxococcales bacterium]|nr:MAG: hypothetical protein H6731_01775 [Myxococcales bacterium]